MTTNWPAPPPAVAERDELPPAPAMARVKVLHVITKFWAGAGGNTLLSAIGMDPERYDVWVAGCEGGPLWERAEAAGLRTVTLKRFREYISPLADLGVLFQLIRLMRRERFAIVHSHSSKAGFLGRIAAWLCNVPVNVYTFHGLSFHDFMSRRRRRFYLAMERTVAKITDRSFAVAPAVANEAVQMRIAKPGETVVIPSAVELGSIPSEADLDARSAIGIDRDATLVGWVGRLDAQKDPVGFVRAAALVARERPDVRFVMVGDGALVDETKAEAAALGVDILFTGFRADAPTIAASVDVFVISSLYEGLGRSLTEALASARPVVATAVNGVPDLVAHGKTGLLVAPRDPEALGRAILWALDHPSQASLMGKQAREVVRTLFRPELMCALLDEQYRDLLGIPKDATESAAPAWQPARAKTRRTRRG